MSNSEEFSKCPKGSFAEFEESSLRDSEEFSEVKKTISEIYYSLQENQEGEVASYIPQLAKVNPDLFGISVCTVKGELFELGDHDIDFCLQSCSKPLTYCLARELYGLETVHSHVGYEPSGQRFNAFVLDETGHPHNPMINAGSIMVCSLIEPEKEPADRFDVIKDFLSRLSGKIGRIGFDNSVFLSEKQHAERNFALAYYMKENHAFVPGVDLNETLELYFQACSISINCTTGAIMAGTLANSGNCPISEEQVCSTETVRDCLSLMYACGMYDYSGQFAFEIGLPAKSGVSGCLMLIIPNEMGICIWSPRLDKIGNTVRGVQFCKELIKRYNFHIFHNMVNNDTCDDKIVLCQKLITAASNGDNQKLRDLVKKIDVNCSDYDGRTALHLASAEGHLETVNLLLELGADPNLLDRWGNSAYHEANKHLKEAEAIDEEGKETLLTPEKEKELEEVKKVAITLREASNITPSNSNTDLEEKNDSLD